MKTKTEVTIDADTVYGIIMEHLTIIRNPTPNIKMVDMGGDFRDDNRVPVLESITFTSEINK